MYVNACVRARVLVSVCAMYAMCGVVWCVVWCGAVRCGVVWCGVGCGVVRCGVVCSVLCRVVWRGAVRWGKKGGGRWNERKEGIGE